MGGGGVIHPLLFQCSWPTVFDAGPTLKQHLVNAQCLVGNAYLFAISIYVPDVDAVGEPTLT